MMNSEGWTETMCFYTKAHSAKIYTQKEKKNVESEIIKSNRRLK